MSPMLSLVIVSLVGAAAPEGQGVSPPPEARAMAAVERVSLEVDHQALLERQKATAAEKSAFFVRDDAARALREQHRVEVTEDATAPAIVVELAWKDYEDSVYLVEIATRRPGEAPRVVEAFEAACINNSALVEAVLERLPAALEQLAEPLEPAPPHAEPSEPTLEPSEVVVEDQSIVDRSSRAPLGRTGKAGVTLLAMGAAGVVAGGVVFAQQRRYVENDQAQLDWWGRDYRDPGIAVMVAGGTVAATGAVLLIVDRARARRRRGTTEPAAWLAPTPTGLVVRGRF